MTLQARDFHILSGTTHRTASLHGRDHIVVPIIALMEGVIRPVNGVGNEFVPADEIAKALQAWNGRPIMPDHPRTADGHVSANHPDVIAQSFGQVFNARFENNKLLMDAYIDPEKAKEVGASAQLDKILAGDAAEVSVGVYVAAEKRKGNFAGKPFDVIWHQIVPDHLAILPAGTRGACSVEMGCGTNRAAAVYDFEEETVESALEVAAFDKAAYMKAYNATKKGIGAPSKTSFADALTAHQKVIDIHGKNSLQAVESAKNLDQKHIETYGKKVHERVKAELSASAEHGKVKNMLDDVESSEHLQIGGKHFYVGRSGHVGMEHVLSVQTTNPSNTITGTLGSFDSSAAAASAILDHVAGRKKARALELRDMAFDKKAYMAAYNAKKKNPGQHAGTQKAIAHSMAEKAKAVNKGSTAQQTTRHIAFMEHGQMRAIHPQGGKGEYRVHKDKGKYTISHHDGSNANGKHVGTATNPGQAASLIHTHAYNTNGKNLRAAKAAFGRK